MSDEKLMNELRALVVEIAELDGELVPEASFKDLGIDSMMGVEIVTAIERKYQIKIAEAELQQVTTLQKSYDLVKAKLDAKA